MPTFVTVVSGPGAGRRVPVQGQLTFGRGETEALRVDSALLSERHGVFLAGADGTAYRPTPGGVRTTLVRGGLGRVLSPEADGPVTLESGDRLLVGYGKDRVELAVDIVPTGPGSADAEMRSVSSTVVVEEERSHVVRARLAVRGVDASDHELRAGDAGALTRLYRLVRALARPASDIEELATRTTEELLAVMPTITHITLFLRGAEPGGLEPVHMRQARDLPHGARGEHIVSRTLLHHVVREREAVLFSDAGDTFSESRSVRAGDIRSTICVPLFFEERLVGVLQIDNRRSPLAFDEADLEVLTLFGQQLAAALENASLRQRLEHAERQLRRENAALRQSLETTLVAESRRMREVHRTIEQVARERIPVTIVGETGTGKELVAETVHVLSRRSGRFVPVNCAAIPRDLVESELFGHVRGAFTGALAAKAGLLAAADGGTLFLDEVTELPLDVQAKLLRALENGEVRPVGSDETRRVDVRFVAATNRDPREAVAAGAFREDLFYRLHVLRIDVPPLRERIEDLPALAEQLLARYRAQSGRDIRGIAPQAIAALLTHAWPGNVRELRNEIERAAVATPEGRLIAPAALASLPGSERGDAHDDEEDGGPLKAAVEAVERRIIADTLARFDGNLTRAAEHLSLSRPGLRMKIKRYGISREVGPEE